LVIALGCHTLPILPNYSPHPQPIAIKEPRCESTRTFTFITIPSPVSDFHRASCRVPLGQDDLLALRGSCKEISHWTTGLWRSDRSSGTAWRWFQ